MNPDGTDTFLEEISRRILTIMREHLPTVLDSVAKDMVASDQEFFQGMGVAVPSTSLEEPRTWLVGAHPPVLEQGVEGLTFPSVSSVCFQKSETADAVGGDQFDFVTHHGHVESIVQSLDFEEAGRMGQRYGKALHRIVTAHPTLDGLCEPMQVSPEAMVSPSFPVGASNTGPGVAYITFSKVRFTFEVAQVRS